MTSAISSGTCAHHTATRPLSLIEKLQSDGVTPPLNLASPCPVGMDLRLCWDSPGLRGSCCLASQPHISALCSCVQWQLSLTFYQTFSQCLTLPILFPVLGMLYHPHLLYCCVDTFFFFLVGVQEAHRNLFPSSSYAFHSSFISCGFGSQFSCWQLLTFKPYLLSIDCTGRQWVCLFIYTAVTTVSFLGGLMPTSNDPGAPCSQLFWPLLSSFLSFMLFVFLSRNALCKVHPARGLADSCLWAPFFRAGPTRYHVLEADLMGSSAVSLGVSLFSLLFRGLFACPLELRTAELLST